VIVKVLREQLKLNRIKRVLIPRQNRYLFVENLSW